MPALFDCHSIQHSISRAQIQFLISIMPRVWECACARSFKSRTAFEQHLDAKGCVEVEPPPDPPRGAAAESGEWIPFVDGKKRLGYLDCPECGKGWMSGNSFLDSWQACRECETDAFPLWRWRSTVRHAPRPTALPNHDAGRCERCLSGRPCVPHP